MCVCDENIWGESVWYSQTVFLWYQNNNNKRRHARRSWGWWVEEQHEFLSCCSFYFHLKTFLSSLTHSKHQMIVKFTMSEIVMTFFLLFFPLFSDAIKNVFNFEKRSSIPHASTMRRAHMWREKVLKPEKLHLCLPRLRDYGNFPWDDGTTAKKLCFTFTAEIEFEISLPYACMLGWVTVQATRTTCS